MSEDFISRKTRQEFREYLVRWSMREISNDFDAAGIERVDVEGSTGSARRDLVDEYYASIDFTNHDDVKKVLSAYEYVLSTIETTDPDGARRLSGWLKRDGYLYRQGRITPIDGEPLPDGRSVETELGDKATIFDTSSTQSVSDAARAQGGTDVFVVYGRNEHARDEIFALLRKVGVRPLEFEQARKLTGKASPYLGEILYAAFEAAQAVIVLFTDDEHVRLRDDLATSQDPKEYELQPRPNVIFEAGMALALHPDRTIIVEMGNLRSISDLVGRHVVRWDGSIRTKKRLLQRVADTGCIVDMSGEDWMS